MFICVHAN